MFFNKKDYKLFILISAVFLLFLGINYYFNYRLIKDNIKRYETELFNRVHTKIQDWVDSNFKDVEKIAKILKQEQITKKEQIQPFLHKFQQSSNFPYLILGLDDGSFFISDNDYVTPHNYNLKARDWYKDTIMANTTIASKPYISMRLGLRSISICTPINFVNLDVKIGVFCGGQPFEVMSNYFNEYESLYNKNLYLINEDGEILASFAKSDNIISFKDKNLQTSKFASFNIKGTKWSIVFEKNQEIYTNQLNKYLFINLSLYILCILIYIITNLFWFKQNDQSSKQINEQNIYIKDVLKQVNGVFISCDKKLNIIWYSPNFDNFYDFKNRENLKTSINKSKYLSQNQKDNFLKELDISLKAGILRYFNITIDDENNQKKFLITTTPISDENYYGISILFQDISLVQNQTNNNGNLSADIDNFYDPHLEKLLLFIKQNIADDGLCIQKLAKISGYSKFHLQRLFKNYTNENIATYIRNYRLNLSKFLLCYSDEKISTIAKQIGFLHTETFIRTFTKAFNLTPSQYQNQKIEISKNQLIYEEIIKQNIKLIISHKVENLYFLKSNEIFIITENGNFQSIIYGVKSDIENDKLCYVELESGRWAKIDLKANKLTPQEALLKANYIFYDTQIYNFKPPQTYFIQDEKKNIDYLFIKI